MSVRIRLARVGAKNQPSYRVVVADERTSRDGSTIEILGYYNPLVEPSTFNVDRDRVLEWLKKGAVPTLTVRKMLGKAGILKPIDFSLYKKRAPKQKGGAKEEKPAEAMPAGRQEKAAETAKTEQKPA